MHIGIVLHPFGDSSKGLEQYIYETTNAILTSGNGDVDFTVFVKGDPDTSSLPSHVRVVNLPKAFFWNLALLPWYKKCDAFVFFTESAPLFLWKKSIIVFFDAAYFYFGSQTVYGRIQRKVLVWWRKCMMQSARHVVVISQASKDDLVDHFSIKPEQVTVIYPGFKTFDASSEVVAQTTAKPFFMYVGPMKERKNVFRIVEAYIAFRQSTNFTHELYLVGRKTKGDYEEKVMTLISGSEYKDSILLKTNVDDEELKSLYATTTALVYPSLLEGFGLPILEALNYGAVAITSSTTSTREVLGDAGLLVDPHYPQEIAEAMKQIAEGTYDREAFKKSAAEQCARFSWEKSGEEWSTLFSNDAIQKAS